MSNISWKIVFWRNRKDVQEIPGNDCFFIKTFSKNMRFTGNIVEKNEEMCANPIETRKNAHVNDV